MTDQLLWDVKGVKQDIAVNTTSAQKSGTRIIKVDKDFAYIPILMAKCFRRRIEDVLRIDRHVSLSEEDPERIAPTIAVFVGCETDTSSETLFYLVEKLKTVALQDLFCKFVPSDVHFRHFFMDCHL